MAIFRIPLTSTNQIFDIHLGGIHYSLELRWNAENMTWVLDISDYDTRSPLVMGIHIVTGCDLLETYKYLGFQGALVAHVEGSDESPDYFNLGGDGNLYFITNVEGFIKEMTGGEVVNA